MIFYSENHGNPSHYDLHIKNFNSCELKFFTEYRYYNRSGHHVSGKEFDGSSPKEYKGVKLKSVLTVNRKGLAAMTSSFFAAICAAFGKYDVVHFHAKGPCAMLWIPKLFGKRCIATIHGIDWQRAKWGGFASKYIKFGEKIAVKYADEIIVLSVRCLSCIMIA